MDAEDPVVTLERIRKYMRDQWSLVPAFPRAHPGSYDRGYHVGMSDTLRGLDAILSHSAGVKDV